MSEENYTNDQLEMFFKLWDLLRTNDNPTNFDLDDVLKQLAFSEKSNTSDLFKLVIDQPAFSSEDNKRFRAFLVDWYASNKAMISRSRNASDVFSLTNDALNELIKSFGFPYPTRIISKNNKCLFLLDLISLYNKKGTPEALTRALQYFGLQNIIINEWWIHKNHDAEFVARSQAIYPRYKRNSGGIKEIPYQEFIENDPLWRLTSAELETNYDSNLISLPSLTPHISLEADLVVSQIYPAIAIITKKMQEAYDFWASGNDLVKDISLNRYDMNVSFLELCLSLCYLFANQTTSSGDLLFQFQGDLDFNDDGVDDYDYEVIIDEWNNINSKPKTKSEKEEKYNKFLEKFTGKQSSFFLGDFSDIQYYMSVINTDLKDLLDNDVNTFNRESALEELMMTLDGYLEQTIEISKYSLGYLIFGSSTYERLKPIIDFFKPYKARIRDFLTSFLIDEPVQNFAVQSDYLYQTIFNPFPDYRDTVLLSDYPINTPIISYSDSLRVLDSLLKDIIYRIDLQQSVTDPLNLRDSLTLENIYQESDESESPFGFDHGLTKDSNSMNVNIYADKLQIDRVSMSDEFTYQVIDL